MIKNVINNPPAHAILLQERRIDNAAAETFFSSLKNELTHHEQFSTIDEARHKLFDYIEVFYNRQRKHQSLGYRSPVEFERLKKVA